MVTNRALFGAALIALTATTGCTASGEKDPRCDDPGFGVGREYAFLCSHLPTHGGIPDPEVGSPGLLGDGICPVVRRSFDEANPTPPVLVAPSGSSIRSDGTRLDLAGIGAFAFADELPRVRYVRRTIPLSEQPESWRVCNSIYFVFVAPA